MSTSTSSEVWAGIEKVLEAAAVSTSDAYPPVSIGTLDDSADDVQRPRRTHVVPKSDVFDVKRGGGRCQRILTFDVVEHFPLAPGDVGQMLDDANAFELCLRNLPALLAALDPPVYAHEVHVLSGADFAPAVDANTATWRASIRYRRP
ncbi:MAG: hypothetical protein IT385_18975 [Deltaproteobacteria bacterium]|nr:hypothetical protein [Deltaproteobacteria bacterium]